MRPERSLSARLPGKRSANLGPNVSKLYGRAVSWRRLKLKQMSLVHHEGWVSCPRIPAAVGGERLADIHLIAGVAAFPVAAGITA